jgi:hypothetical protein
MGFVGTAFVEALSLGLRCEQRPGGEGVCPDPQTTNLTSSFGRSLPFRIPAVP